MLVIRTYVVITRTTVSGKTHVCDSSRYVYANNAYVRKYVRIHSSDVIAILTYVIIIRTYVRDM